MFPLGKLPATLRLRIPGRCTHLPKCLWHSHLLESMQSSSNILPPHYPQPIPSPTVHMATLSPLHAASTVPLKAQHITSEYPTL